MASIRRDAEVYHCFADLHRSLLLPSEPSESGAVCQVGSCRLQTSFAVWKYPAVRFRDLEFFFTPLFHHCHHFHRSLFCSPKSNKLGERDHQPAGRKPIFIIFIILHILRDLLRFLVHLFRCFKQAGIWQQAPSSILSLL